MSKVFIRFRKIAVTNSVNLSFGQESKISYSNGSFLWLNNTLRKKWNRVTLREKCPNTEFFLVRIFPHSEWIRKDTNYLSVFTLNVGKYGPEKTPFLDTFHAVNPPPITILESESAADVSWEWLKFLERPVNILKKESTVEVLLGDFQNFSEQLFFFETLIDGCFFKMWMNEYEIVEEWVIIATWWQC